MNHQEMLDKYRIDTLEEAGANLIEAAQELRNARDFERSEGRTDLVAMEQAEKRIAHGRALAEEALQATRRFVPKDINRAGGKARLVDELTTRIRNDVIRKYVPEMPDEWEGIHLRCLLADTFVSETNFHHRPAARRAITTSGFYMRVGRV